MNEVTPNSTARETATAIPRALKRARGIQAFGLGEGAGRRAPRRAVAAARAAVLPSPRYTTLLSISHRRGFCPAPQAARPALSQRFLCQSSGGLLDVVAGEQGAVIHWVKPDQLVRRIPLPRKRALKMRKRRTGIVQVNPSRRVRTGAILLGRRGECYIGWQTSEAFSASMCSSDYFQLV